MFCPGDFVSKWFQKSMENIQFRAFHHIEGLYKVAVEFGLMAIFHNFKKLGKIGKGCMI